MPAPAQNQLQAVTIVSPFYGQNPDGSIQGPMMSMPIAGAQTDRNGNVSQVVPFGYMQPGYQPQYQEPGFAPPSYNMTFSNGDFEHGHCVSLYPPGTEHPQQPEFMAVPSAAVEMSDLVAHQRQRGQQLPAGWEHHADDQVLPRCT